MSVLRVECPECGTSFRSDTLNLKTGHGDKAIVKCMCGKWLKAEFHETPAGRNWWGRKLRPSKGVKVSVKESV